MRCMYKIDIIILLLLRIWLNLSLYMVAGFASKFSALERYCTGLGFTAHSPSPSAGIFSRWGIALTVVVIHRNAGLFQRLRVLLLAFLSAVEKGDKVTVSSYIRRYPKKWKTASKKVRRVVSNQKVKTSIVSRRI